jgi:hypothetical protein
MKGSMASAVKNSPKRAVPSFNKKGAFGQAKFARALGARAVGAPSMVASQTDATKSFLGETVRTGDVGSAGGGVGLGGAGITSGSKLKTSDPSLNSNNSTPPKVVPPPENVSPWKKYTDMALYAMLAASVLIFITGLLAKKAQDLAVKAAAAPPPLAAAAWAAAAAMYGYAQIAAYAAMAASALVLFAGVMLMGKFGQKWTGIMYMAAGGMLMIKAYQALSGMEAGSKEASAKAATLQMDAAGSSVAPANYPTNAHAGYGPDGLEADMQEVPNAHDGYGPDGTQPQAEDTAKADLFKPNNSAGGGDGFPTSG